MKKLFLTGFAIASLIALNLQAQPVAQNHMVFTGFQVYHGGLSNSVQGGIAPLTYTLVGNPLGGTLALNANTGDFTFTFNPALNPLTFADGIMFGEFHYRVTDANGMEDFAAVYLNYDPSIQVKG